MEAKKRRLQGGISSWLCTPDMLYRGDIFPSILKEKHFVLLFCSPIYYFQFYAPGCVFNNLFANIGYNLKSKECKGGKT